MLTDVVCIQCANTPGSLSAVLDYLAAENIFIEYMYAFSEGDTARTIIRPTDLSRCIEILQKSIAASSTHTVFDRHSIQSDGDIISKMIPPSLFILYTGKTPTQLQQMSPNESIASPLPGHRPLLEQSFIRGTPCRARDAAYSRPSTGSSQRLRYPDEVIKATRSPCSLVMRTSMQGIFW